MKKAFFTLTALCLICSTIFAQDLEIPILLDDGQQEQSFVPLKDQLNNPVLGITVKKGEPGRNGKTAVTLTIENHAPQQFVFWLFGQRYDEIELKDRSRFPRRIVYDKNFGFHGKTDVYRIGTGNYDNIYLPDISIGSDNGRFDNYLHYDFDIRIEESDTDTCVLPIYFGKNKNGLFCRRTILETEKTITLYITVENQARKDYERLRQRCDSLFDAINDTIFCLHKSHRPSLDKQKEPYLKTRDNIRDEIRATLDNNNWPKDHINRKRYDELINKLDEVEEEIHLNEVEDCGDAKIHVPVHNCNYCKWTFKQIYDRLDRYNKQIDNGDVTKAEVIKEVKQLYKCYQSGPKTASNKRKEQLQQYKSKIEDLYKKINSY